MEQIVLFSWLMGQGSGIGTGSLKPRDCFLSFGEMQSGGMRVGCRLFQCTRLCGCVSRIDGVLDLDLVMMLCPVSSCMQSQ